MCHRNINRSGQRNLSDKCHLNLPCCVGGAHASHYNMAQHVVTLPRVQCAHMWEEVDPITFSGPISKHDGFFFNSFRGAPWLGVAEVFLSAVGARETEVLGMKPDGFCGWRHFKTVKLWVCSLNFMLMCGRCLAALLGRPLLDSFALAQSSVET